ncbi:uncharacterized protein LOC108468475 [Gossypium arboreum]|uniref:uncharacterized protein LOC108468475 n=1 Tax=Gossypium arboreum TaxID=29729 RepID=UPI00081920AD|nr:uncharacterized protein LOC108468475 [Gossypium arboreum]
MSEGWEEARVAFFEMMYEWFGEYLRNHPEIPRPPPPATRPDEVPRVVEPIRLGKAPVDKPRKYEAEEVLDELSYAPEESLKYVVSLLKDTAYHWWKTISSVAPRESITWEFFQLKFKKEYVSQRFLDQKRKEFLELKQGNRTVSEYEREFVRLSQYAKEWVQTEAEMCKHSEEGLNKDIKLLIGILEIRELATLADLAKKVKELNNERKQAKRET